MKIKWTFERLSEEALKYKTKGEFKKNNRRAYAASSVREDHDIICSHMPMHLNRFGREADYISWTDEELKKEALKYTKRILFVRGNRNAYFSALRKGKEFLDMVCSHMDPPLTRAYSDEELLEIARSFSSRGEFQKNSAGASKAARKRGNIFFNHICSHMPYRISLLEEKNHKFIWSIEKIISESSKYLRRIDFQKGSPGAANAARRKGIHDFICKGMKKSNSVSYLEKELFEIIKSIYPKTQKLRDMNVKIKGKPHIHGFDLDIYIPELYKAIEFDGKYWHSDAGLKRSRKHWPQEDIDLYHQLKDSWFASKDIQILHIKEEDWNKGKELCVKKCLEFLKP